MPYPTDPHAVRTDEAPYLGTDQNGWFCYEAPFQTPVGYDEDGTELFVTSPHQRLTPDVLVRQQVNRWEGGVYFKPAGTFEAARARQEPEPPTDE